jgi:hypothetical protein
MPSLHAVPVSYYIGVQSIDDFYSCHAWPGERSMGPAHEQIEAPWKAVAKSVQGDGHGFIRSFFPFDQVEQTGILGFEFKFQ